MSEFVREGRYIVVKPDHEDDIRTERLRNYIEEMCFKTPECVVVEADWPEYEMVWRMIERRVTGQPVEDLEAQRLRADTAEQRISFLENLIAEAHVWIDQNTFGGSDAYDLRDRLIAAINNEPKP
ncbi:hypothetical protein [Pseudomonas sp. MONT-RG-20F-20-E-7-02]|uniref:hypothetical protein n=1 Tax=Pseudomonas sp. MONT-RG-20F-20-E-7-02 TaxID=2914979 RepID=UPI001F564D6B|nr:hypothetical protein [Pseudomonas sp. MONT-RG-20F-20-E-7-02]